MPTLDDSGATGPGERLPHVRVLMYSHDTFGLGHLRRCRAIAHALVERFKGVHVLIVSGSSIAGAFDFRTRVDFLKVPSIIKLMNGEYTPLSQHTDLHETLALRRSLILNTAESFRPDIMIVDKEPLGLRGELEPTLGFLKKRGTMLVLGLRDVMDSRGSARGRMGPQRRHRQDGCALRCGLGLRAGGFPRSAGRSRYPGPIASAADLDGLSAPRGAGRAAPARRSAGECLARDGGRWRRRCGADAPGRRRLSRGPDLAWPAILVLGPFMRAEEREELYRKCASLPALSLIDFDSRLEAIMQSAAGVVSMGGYNTFCEILSLDKRALIVPRTSPREEQLIRTQRAAGLGLVDMLLPEEAEDPGRMAAALHRLSTRIKPSETAYGRPLDGLVTICDLVQDYMVGGAVAERLHGVATEGRA